MTGRNDRTPIIESLNACAKLDDRRTAVARALRLEYLTVGWNVVEGVVAIAAGLAAGSIALLAFGIDSFVEVSSAAVLIWRLRAESSRRDHEAVERLDRKAHRLVGLSLFALAGWVTFDATRSLWLRERPEGSAVGLVLLCLSLAAMWWLARAKRAAAGAIQSAALHSDAFQTTACWWLSLIALIGIGLNTALGWWWADPAAALGMVFFISKEGREAWRGEDCGCEPQPRGSLGRETSR